MRNSLNQTFLFLLIFLVLIGSYLIMKPFLIAILVAFVLSQMFKNFYESLLKITKNRKELSSFISVTLVLLLIIIPITLIITFSAKEINTIYKEVQANQILDKAKNFSFNIFGFSLDNQIVKDFYQSDGFTNRLEGFSDLAISIIQTAYQGTSSFIFMTFVMFFALYYFFKDGDALIKKTMNLSPLKNKQEELLLTQFIAISRATLKGSLVIAIIQALMISILFWATGVISPVLWGLTTVIMALVPLVGAGIIWAPVGIIMLLLGHIWQGFIILFVGGFIISTIDNLLRPILVGNETSLHPLLVFLSTLGGIALFGMAGFLLGPIIIALLVTLLDIYEIEFKKELKKFNN